jgi:hypothetical protein
VSVGMSTSARTAGSAAGQCAGRREPVLVLRGEPGIGKTALLSYLLGRASGCRTARAVGVESEMELAFAGLHQLCAPFLDRLDRLPGPQRDALRTAFGLRPGRPGSVPGRAGGAEPAADVAEEQPLVCVIDDAQWLDRSRRRRSRSSRAACWPSGSRWCSRCASPATADELTGLPELVPGLATAMARAAADSVISGPVDERCATGSSPRRAATRSPCWSCRVG